MKTTSVSAGKWEKQAVVTDESLRERFDKSPLFAGKTEKAVAIMNKVREKDGNA